MNVTLTNNDDIWPTGADNSGNDQVLGLDGDDRLTGGNGNDYLNGGSGADRMSGGEGNDRYEVDNILDVVIDDGSNAGQPGDDGEHDDVILSSVSYTLGANIENLYLQDLMRWDAGAAQWVVQTRLNINGTGNERNNALEGSEGNNILRGMDGNDWLYGRPGNDTLYGGNGNDFLDGQDGTDVMYGGAGDDIYFAGSREDTIVEDTGDGRDRVYSAYDNYTLGTNLEDLLLVRENPYEPDEIMGNGRSGNGNSLRNRIYGNALNNVLDGRAGADFMYGGLGNDTYIVDDLGDVVQDAISIANFFDQGVNLALREGGDDTVRSSVTFALGANLENLALTGSADLDGTGNELANTIIGNAGDNILYGSTGNDILNGGAGNDYLRGGSGNDTASFDTATREVRVDLGLSAAQATSGAGRDTLVSIENLIGSNYSDTLAGNAGDNRVFGGRGNDSLTGGDGDDYLNGGIGSDFALYSSATAAVNIDLNITTAQETGGAGSDTLTGIEKLTGSVFADTLTGNARNNILGGGLGNDTLSGNSGNDWLFGGAGRDSLSGGTGTDTFVFDKPLNSRTNIDTITDFDASADTINLDRTIFAGLPTTGLLSSANFRVSLDGSGGANEYILYNQSSGALLYDRDSNGAGVAVQFATLTNRPHNVTAADFMVVA